MEGESQVENLGPWLASPIFGMVRNSIWNSIEISMDFEISKGFGIQFQDLLLQCNKIEPYCASEADARMGKKKKKPSSALKQWKKDMFWACSKGEKEKVKLYMDDARAPSRDVNTFEIDKAGNRPLHVACLYWKSPALADFLLGRGARVDQLNDYGKTALHIAAHQGSGSKGVDEAAIQWLIAKGANIELKDSSGKTALDCATAMGNKRVEKLLKSASSSSSSSIGSGCGSHPPASRRSNNSIAIPAGAWGDEKPSRGSGSSSSGGGSGTCILL